MPTGRFGSVAVVAAGWHVELGAGRGSPSRSYPLTSLKGGKLPFANAASRVHRPRGLAMLAHRPRRPGLVLTHQARVADDVNGHDCGEKIASLLRLRLIYARAVTCSSPRAVPRFSPAVPAQPRARDGLPSGLQLTIRSSDEDHNSTYGRVAIFAMQAGRLVDG